MQLALLIEVFKLRFLAKHLDLQSKHVRLHPEVKEHLKTELLHVKEADKKPTSFAPCLILSCKCYSSTFLSKCNCHVISWLLWACLSFHWYIREYSSCLVWLSTFFIASISTKRDVLIAWNDSSGIFFFHICLEFCIVDHCTRLLI